jgi:hypothetical protein
MNIFALDADPALAAQYHSNIHVIKMILETAQLLCTAHHCSGAQYPVPYKKTHQNHPSAIWCRANVSNYKWLASLGKALCKEYTYRFGKIHKTEAVIDWAITNIPNIPDGELTVFAQAMPDECKGQDPVEAYRKYYAMHKASFLIRGKVQLAKWSGREPPAWFVDRTGHHQ